MKAPYVAVERVIAAPAHLIYRIVSDYATHHPKILPKPFFASLDVEEGGIGAGTVFRVSMNALGTKQTLRMKVTEPQPGSVIMEEDPSSGVATTFTITPIDGNGHSRVQIATEWKPKTGFEGFMERLLNPAIARSVYKKELKLLADYVAAYK